MQTLIIQFCIISLGQNKIQSETLYLAHVACLLNKILLVSTKALFHTKKFFEYITLTNFQWETTNKKVCFVYSNVVDFFDKQWFF